MSRQSRSIKVGVFVVVGLLLATIAVFLIGDNRRVWDRKVTYKGRVHDVVGHKAGSAVRRARICHGYVKSLS